MINFLLVLIVVKSCINCVLAHFVKYRDSAVSCAQMTEAIECSLGCWVGWVQGTCITWWCRCPHIKIFSGVNFFNCN